MTRYLTIITGLLLISACSYGQVFKVGLNQPDPLHISLGSDTTLCHGHNVILGGFPTATGGTEEYLYVWTPATGLDNPTSPNPIATPDETTKYVLTVVDASGCELSESINIEIDLCLGIEDQLFIEDLMIYPNPSSGNITISGIPMDLSDIKISLINSIGMEISATHVENGINSVNLDLESLNLPGGVYFVRILATQGLIIRKIQLI